MEQYISLTPQQIDVAVEWWAKDLVGATFKMADPDSGEFGNEAVVAGGLGLTVRAALAATRYTPEQIEQFRAALRGSLENPPEFFDLLRVDYHPSEVLQSALEAAGITARYVLSTKTTMWFADGGVQVRHGIGAPTVDVLPRTTS